MAIPRTPVTIDTSDTFNTWLTNTNHAIDILKNIVTDTILTHASGAYTASEILSQGSAILTHDDPSPVFVAGRTLTGEISGATAIVHSSPAPATGATTVSYTSVASLIGDSVVAGTTANSTAFVVGEVINQATTNAVGVVTGIQGNAATTGNGAGKISYTTTSGTFTGNSTITGATSSTTIGTSLTYTTGEVVTESTSSNTAILATVGAPTVNATGIAKVVGATTTNVVTTSGAFNTNFTVAGATSNIKKIPSAVTTSHLATTNAALTTPTLTTPTIASNMVVNGNTLTLPTSADTLVGRATTDNLTNKTITGATIIDGSMSGIAITNNAITSAPTISVDDGGTIGTDTDADAITIAAAGAVTFSQRDVHTLGITVANGQTIGSASDADAITIASAGAVTFSQRSVHSAGITIANAGEIGSVGDTNAITISSGGVVAITATTANTSATDGALTVAGGVGIAADVTIGDDLRLITDASVIHFGVDSEITVTHVVDKGLTIKNENTAGTSGVGGILTLATGDEDIADGNILGQIKFQAPDEGTGTDAVLVAGGIAVRSEGDFSASNNATEMVFNTGLSGDVSIGATGGDLILSSAGVLKVTGGIEFPATFANNANANTLDDYEEGSWTPSFGATTTAPSLTYSTQNGRYIKIGRVVNVYFEIGVSGAASAGSGYLTVAGLPFTSSGDVDEVPLGVGRANGWADNANSPVTVQVEKSTTYCYCMKTFYNTTLSGSDLDSSLGFTGGGTYIT